MPFAGGEHYYAYWSSGQYSPDIASLNTSLPIAVDLETKNLYSHEVIGTSLCIDPKKGSYFIPSLLSLSNHQRYIFHNANFDLRVLKRNGVSIPEDRIEDTWVQAHLIEEKDKRLSSLAHRYFGARFAEYKTSISGAEELSLSAWAAYSCPHSLYTYMLYELFSREITRLGMEHLYRDIQLPLIPIIIDMEDNGIAIDTSAITTLKNSLMRECELLNEAMVYWGGLGVNFSSGEQVGRLMLKLGIPLTRLTQKKKLPSTRNEHLVSLRGTHPFINLLIRDRACKKLLNTFIAEIESSIGEDSRIHPHFNQTGTGPGRFSSTNPNGQNIPVRSEEGKKVRRAFVAGPGMVLVVADYSQIELRCLAFCSNDQAMTRAYRENKDLHLETAIDVIGDPRRRFAGKTMNFSLVYGSGDEGLAKDANVSVATIREWKEKYFQKYWGVARYIERVRESAQRTGKVVTPNGRVRTIPGLTQGESKKDVEHALRQAVNTIIQGFAAEIVQQGMIRMSRAIAGTRAKLLLQVHDELVYECPPEEVKDLVRTMEEVLPHKDFDVPVEIGVGHSWGELTKYDRKGWAEVDEKKALR